jgi:hypothetical protein
MAAAIGKTIKKRGLNRMRRFTVLVVALSLLVSVFAVGMVQAKELTFGYIAPGPDTWYRRKMGILKWPLTTAVHRRFPQGH